jgi:hypothetical protein
MARLDELIRGATVNSILPDGPITIVDVRWFGTANALAFAEM